MVLLLGGGMVAGGTVALRALLDRGSPGTGSGSGQIGGSTEPPATPASEVLPDWTTGEWSGEVYQPTGQVTSYEVQISLQAGVAQGQLEIPDLGCAGALTVKSSTESTVVLTTRLEDDLEGGCVDQSTLQLTRAGGDQLLYAWKDDGQAGNHADGTVTRE